MATSTDRTLDQLPSGFELIADPVVLFGERMLDCNEAFADLCGRSRAVLSAMPLQDLFANPEQLCRRLDAVKMDEQQTDELTLDIVGVAATLSVSLSRVPDEKTEKPRIIAVGQSLSTSNSQPPPVDYRTQALTDAHEIIADSSRPLDEKIDAVLELVRTTLDTEFAMVSQVEDDDYIIKALTPPDDIDVSPGETVPLEWTNCERIVTTEQTLVLDDIESDPMFADREANKRFGLSSYLGAPVRSGDDLYGTFCLYSRSQRQEGFSDWEVTFVDFLSNWLSYEIEREQLLAQIRKEERQRYETLVTQSSDGVVVIEDRVFSFVNDQFAEMTGYSREELLGMAFEQLVCPESRELVARRYEKRLAGDAPPSAYEIDVESKTGERLTFELSVSRIQQHGEPAVLANIRDITQRKHHQQAVSALQTATDRMQQADEAETVARIATESGSSALDLPYATCWFHDSDGETDWLQAVAATEVVKREGRMVSLSADRYEYAAFERGELTEYVPTAVEADASFETGVLLPLGEHGLLAVGHRESTDRDELLIDVAQALADHTTIALDRIKRTERIRENERRFRAIFNHTYQFTGLLEPDGTLIEANNTALEFGGLAASDVLGKPLWEAYWFNDRPTLQKTVRIAVDRAANGEFIREELTITGSDQTAVVDFSIRPITNDSGEVVLLIPEGRDITELKQREMELKRQRDHVHRTERLAAVGGWEFDNDTQSLRVTDGTRKLFGLDAATLHPHTALEYIHTEDRKRLRESLDACRSTGESIDTELQTSTTVSRTQWLQLTGERVDETTVRGAIRDISARKERGQRLTVLNRVLRHNLRNRLTVVTAYATELESKLTASADRAADTPAFSVEAACSQVKRIQQSTQELLAVAEKVRSFEKVVARAEERGSVAVGRVLSSLLEEYRQQYPYAEIDAELVDQTLAGDEEILRLAVGELLQNAILHSDQSNPQISVTVREQIDRGTITIADDGPGIPKQERDVLRSGTETPLEHGSGIGLWTVQWLISRIGGNMTIADNTPRGTAVSLRLSRTSSA